MIRPTMPIRCCLRRAVASAVVMADFPGSARSSQFFENSEIFGYPVRRPSPWDSQPGPAVLSARKQPVQTTPGTACRAGCLSGVSAPASLRHPAAVSGQVIRLMGLEILPIAVGHHLSGHEFPVSCSVGVRASLKVVRQFDDDRLFRFRIIPNVCRTRIPPCQRRIDVTACAAGSSVGRTPQP